MTSSSARNQAPEMFQACSDVLFGATDSTDSSTTDPITAAYVSAIKSGGVNVFGVAGPPSWWTAGGSAATVSGCGDTPLHLAAYTGNKLAAETLIQEKADVNARDNTGYTPLHVAASRNHVSVAQVLIGAQANVNAVDKNGHTSLHWAAERGHESVARLLVNANAKLGLKDKNGMTPLDYAVLRGRKPLVRLLGDVTSKSAETQGGARPATTLGQEYSPSRPNNPPLSRHRSDVQRGEVNSFSVDRESIIDDALHRKSTGDSTQPEVATCKVATNMQGPSIFVASSGGHIREVRSIIDAGADLDIFDGNGFSPLILAARNGYDAVVTALVDGGANVELKQVTARKMESTVTRESMTALQYACAFNHANVVQVLLDAGARVNVLRGDSVNAPLITAARAGNYVIVKMLTESGADSQVADNRGRTALHWACYQGHALVTRLLLNAGAQKDLKDVEGMTPLMLGARNNCFEIVRMLIEAGSNTLAKNFKGQGAREIALAKGYNEQTAKILRLLELHESGSGHTTPSTHIRVLEDAIELDMKIAAQIGDLTVIQIQTRAGANVNAVDERGWTPLMHAAFFGHEKVVDALLESGAQFEAVENEDNRTALYLGCSFGHERVVDALMKAGANVNVRNKSGCTPLMLAAYKNNSGLLKMLLSHGANIEAVDNKQRTALLRACAFGRPSMARLLLDHDANVEAVDSEGMTPLLLCAQKGYTEIGCMLIDARANTKVVDKDGMTPLHWSARNGHIDIVKVLIAAKVSIDLTDQLGRTPLGWAACNGHSEVARILIDGGANVLVKDKSHQMPMGLAFKNGHVDLHLELLGAGMLQRNQCSCHQTSYQSCNTSSFPSLARVGSMLAQADGVRIQSNFKSDGNGDAHVNEASDSKPRADAIENLPSQIGSGKANLKSGDDATSDILSAGLSASVGRDASVATTDSWISVDDLSSRTNSLVREREEFVFVDNESSFPIHSAVVRSNGDLNEFEKLTNGIDLRTNTTSVTMRMKKVRVKTARISINAAEYAFALGYRELGEYLVQELRQIGQVHEDMSDTSKADSVTLSKYDEMTAIVQAVRFSQGRVRSFQAVAGDLVGTATLGVTLEAEIVRSETISEHTWLPVQLAAALQYAEITMRLVAM